MSLPILFLNYSVKSLGRLVEQISTTNDFDGVNKLKILVN